jgi:hypothetical protein
MSAGDAVPEPLLKQVVSLFRAATGDSVRQPGGGDARSDSDFDLVVVLDDDVPEALGWIRLLRQEVFKLGPA